MWYLRQRNGAASSDAYTLSYSGYPESNGEYWQTALDGVDENMDILKDQYQSDLDNLNSAWQEKYDSLLDKLDSGTTNSGGTVSQHYGTTSHVNSPSSTVDFFAVRDQMEYNSNLALLTNGIDDELHAQNLALGKSIGASYDEETGTWWYSNQALYAVNTEYNHENGDNYLARDPSSNYVVYDTNMDYMSKIGEAIRNNAGGAMINTLNTQRNAKIEAKGKTVDSYNVYYDKNTDYSALIAQAKAQGADASVIENLTQQREAKIRGEKMTHRYNELRS